MVNKAFDWDIWKVYVNFEYSQNKKNKKMAGFAAQAALRSKWTSLVEDGIEVPPEVSNKVTSVVGWLKQVLLHLHNIRSFSMFICFFICVAMFFFCLYNSFFFYYFCIQAPLLFYSIYIRLGMLYFIIDDKYIYISILLI